MTTLLATRLAPVSLPFHVLWTLCIFGRTHYGPCRTTILSHFVSFLPANSARHLLSFVLLPAALPAHHLLAYDGTLPIHDGRIGAWGYLVYSSADSGNDGLI